MFCYNAGLVAAIGLAVSYLFVLYAPRRAVQTGNWASSQARLRGPIALAGALLILVSYADFALTIARSQDHPDYARAFLPATIARFIAAPADEADWISAGLLALIQYGLLGLAGAVLLASRWRRIAGPGIAVGLALSVLGVVVSVLPTRSGALSGDDLAQSLLLQVHIIGAAVWVGGLLGLALLAVLERRHGSDHANWPQIWARFSQVAAVSVGAILISGLWLTWKHVGSIAQFVTTPYGRFLAAKIILVLIMIIAGGYNQQVLLPRIARIGLEQGSEAAVRHLSSVVRVEAMLGVAVIAIVPFLTGSARKEAAGGGPADPIDGRILALGLLLMGLIAFGLWSAHRYATSFGRISDRAENQ